MVSVLLSQALAFVLVFVVVRFFVCFGTRSHNAAQMHTCDVYPSSSHLEGLEVYHHTQLSLLGPRWRQHITLKKLVLE